MGMSIHVTAFKPPDETWRKMKAVWDSCETAGVDPPNEVTKYFNYEYPDERGVEINENSLRELGAAAKYNETDRSGFEVDLSKLPPDVKVIRFYCSW